LIHETKDALAAALDETHRLEDDAFAGESRTGERVRYQSPAAEYGKACLPFARRQKQGVELILDSPGIYRDDLVPRPEETAFPVNSVDANRHRCS
jgi:hypothetical protein